MLQQSTETFRLRINVVDLHMLFILYTDEPWDYGRGHQQLEDMEASFTTAAQQLDAGELHI